MSHLAARGVQLGPRRAFATAERAPAGPAIQFGGYRGAAAPSETPTGTGCVRRNARANAAAEAQAYFVQASVRFRPTMSLMPRIASIGHRSCAARYTPPDSISTASRLRAVVIQGNSTVGSFTKRSLDAMGPDT